jgi:flagellar secretion chaperone FliS
MWKDAYLESRVLSADPLELIRMLYQFALDSVRDARRHLAAGDIVARSRSVGKVIGAIAELEGSLNHADGGAISRNLADLYQYIRQRLTEANLQQKDAPLAEAESLLTTLSEAWKATLVQPAPEYCGVQPGAALPISAWQESAGGSAHMWNA